MFDSGGNSVLAIKQENGTWNEIHLFPAYEHEIRLLSPSLECFWLSLMFILSLFSLPNLFVFGCFLIFLTILSKISVLLACFLLACFLTCLHTCLLFLTGTDTEFTGIALACFPILFSLAFLLYCFNAFPFVCLSLFFLFSSIFSASFSPLCTFSPLVIPSSPPK